MKVVLIGAVVIILLSFTATDVLTGRWETKPSDKGNVTGVVFKPDNSFEGYINKKPFVTGTYILQDSIFTFTDNGCDGLQGVYSIVLFSNSDSLRFECIHDDCEDRKRGMGRLTLGKVK